MGAPTFTDAALTASGKIGRYFSIVTVLPTLFLVLWAYAIYRSDAWWDEPNMVALRDQLTHWSIPEVASLLLGTLVLALFLHPLQYATVQLLEGYWGASPLALAAAHLRVRHHRRRRETLLDRLDTHDDEIDAGHKRHHPDKKQDAYLDTAEADEVMPHVVMRDARQFRVDRYPRGGRILPTRLGNALRRYEDHAGTQYGLEAMHTAPHFWLVIPESHLVYVRDSRQLLDTTVRLCFVSLVATMLTVSATLTDGLWLLTALIPYGFAYLAYRAAISAVDEYGTAVETIIDLDRFLLYDSLGVARPANTTEERTTNEQLMALLKGNHQAEVTYVGDETRRAPGTNLLRRLFRRGDG